VTVQAMVTGTMLVGFIGWTTFIADRSDSGRKQLMGALRLGQEQAVRLAQPD
jgi:hypothetical protein